MKKIITGTIFSMLLAAALAVFAPGAVKQAEAAEAQIGMKKGESFGIWYDPKDQCIHVGTNDIAATTGIRYRTMRITVSRGKFNTTPHVLDNGESTEYVEVTYTQGEETRDPKDSSRVTNDFKIPLSEIQGKASGAWNEEINKALTENAVVWMRVDCGMEVDSVAVRMRGGKKVTTWNKIKPSGGYYYNYPGCGGRGGGNLNEDADENPYRIQHAEPWIGGARNGLASHSHRWVPISSGIPKHEPEAVQQPAPQIVGDHHITTGTGGLDSPDPGHAQSSTSMYYGDYTGSPIFGGGNGNLEGYSAAFGVPTTSSITGAAEVSPWFGNIDVWARMRTKQYKDRYRYKWIPGEGNEYAVGNSIALAKDQAKDARDKDWVLTEPNFDVKLGHDNPENNLNSNPKKNTYHFWLKTKWQDNPANPSKTVFTEAGIYDPGAPMEGDDEPPTPPTPKWLCGWKTWHTWREPGITGKMETHSSTGYVGGDNEAEARANEPHDPPSTADESWGHSAVYANCTDISTQWRTSAVIDRLFWDEPEFNRRDDKAVQIYAAFEYIDKFKSKAYDFAGANLYNDIYGAMSFGQTVDTKMKWKKSKGDGKTTLELVDFTNEPGEVTGKWTIDAKDINTNDYLIWAEPLNIKTLEGTPLRKHYEGAAGDFHEYLEYLFANTKTQNDFVQCENPLTDQYMSFSFNKNGTLIGNSDEAEKGGIKGVVSGCDFRDAKTAEMGYESLGSVEGGKLDGEENGHILTANFGPDNDASNLWSYCLNSAACRAESNGYKNDGEKNRLAGVTRHWEKLIEQTMPISENTANGEYPTEMGTQYAREIGLAGTSPALVQQRGSCATHVYSADESQAVQIITNERGDPDEWGGAYVGDVNGDGLGTASGAGGMDGDGNILDAEEAQPNVNGNY